MSFPFSFFLSTGEKMIEAEEEEERDTDSPLTHSLTHSPPFSLLHSGDYLVRVVEMLC